ncbi:hypothetical protein [Melittangium boletus]|uniref:hypothetical protein n=1 Tax=Melittangium boletus TaxID=83453 RepID=UPI003DA3FAAD
MRLPTLFRGTHAQVAARCRKLLSPLKKGRTLAELVGPVDGDPTAEGRLVVTVGPSAALKGTEAFHIYLLHGAVRTAAVDGTLADVVEARVFEESLGVPWGVVALNAQRSLDWFHTDARSVSLIDATARFWEELHAAGDVFAGRFPPGKSFWDALPTARPGLKKLGLGDDEIHAVATDGLPAVLRRNGWTAGEGFTAHVRK